MSVDGSFVVGVSGSVTADPFNPGSTLAVSEAFIWSEDGGLTGLGNVPVPCCENAFSSAIAVSSNGVAVGIASDGDMDTAFRHSNNGEEINVTSGDSAIATGVSADGSVVVGTVDLETDIAGFRWKDQSIEFFRATDFPSEDPFEPPSTSAGANAVSADGSVVVGREGFRGDTGYAVAWINGGRTELENRITCEVVVPELDITECSIQDPDKHTSARSVSADGSLIVGTVIQTGEPLKSFVWSSTDGVQEIGAFEAKGVSDTGVVVGSAAGTNTATIWTSDQSDRNLQDVLADEFGLASELQDWTLTEATGISADGRTIVGTGTNPSGNQEAWRVVLDQQLRAGDADRDFDFDQRDLVVVFTAGKYLTGQAATWGEGDWNGAPGGGRLNPPAGDGLFNQHDLVAAQRAETYLTGPYASVASSPAVLGDGQTSIVYDPASGEVEVDAPSGVELTSINIDSAAGVFTGDAAANLGGSFDNDSDANIFKATFGGSFGSLSFGSVAQTGLALEFLLNDLTVVGSLAGGGELGNVDLVYVPEPASACLLAIGLAGALLHFRRNRAASKE